jgi:hypothetical protein
MDLFTSLGMYWIEEGELQVEGEEENRKTEELRKYSQKCGGTCFWF